MSSRNSDHRRETSRTPSRSGSTFGQSTPSPPHRQGKRHSDGPGRKRSRSPSEKPTKTHSKRSSSPRMRSPESPRRRGFERSEKGCSRSPRRYKRSYSKSPVRDRRSISPMRRGRRSRSPRRSDERRRVETPRPCRVLGVFGLNYHTTRRDLEREFGRFGRLERVDLVCDPSGFSRGFGFIGFEHQNDADEARRTMANSIFDGKRIRVDYSISRGPHEKTPGRYLGNGGFRRDYYSSNPRRFDRVDRDDRDRDIFRRRSRSRTPQDRGSRRSPNCYSSR